MVYKSEQRFREHQIRNRCETQGFRKGRRTLHFEYRIHLLKANNFAFVSDYDCFIFIVILSRGKFQIIRITSITSHFMVMSLYGNVPTKISNHDTLVRCHMHCRKSFFRHEISGIFCPRLGRQVFHFDSTTLKDSMLAD